MTIKKWMDRFTFAAVVMTIALPAVGFARGGRFDIPSPDQVEVPIRGEDYDYCELLCATGTTTDLALELCLKTCENMYCSGGSIQQVPTPGHDPRYRVIPFESRVDDPGFSNFNLR